MKSNPMSKHPKSTNYVTIINHSPSYKGTAHLLESKTS